MRAPGVQTVPPASNPPASAELSSSTAVVVATQGRGTRFAMWAREHSTRPREVILVYCVLLAASEITTFLLSAALGMIMYGVVLVAILLHASFLWQQPVHRALLSLTFVPIIRLVSLSVPLGQFPLIQAYAITGVPLIISALVSMRSMRMRPREVGLGLGRRPLLQLFVIPTGLLLGVAEYLILRPEPMVQGSSWSDFIVPAIILLVCTGFAEEFMFRGIMQETMRPIFGTSCIVLVSIIFTVQHIGYRSPLDLVVVMVAGLMFGVVAYRCRSIWAVTLAHGLTNIVLFLICPAIAASLAASI
jgi:membrane protease YdiL (CAAX protease family)